MSNNNHIAVARVGKLFGEANTGGVSLTLYDTFDEVVDPDTEPLFVEIDSLDVPLWCNSFERRGQRGATVHFADFDTPRRAEELLGKELYVIAQEQGESDEFYMEDLIGFTVEAEGLRGEITDYYDSDINPLFGIDFGSGEQLVPAVEEFIVQIDFDNGHIKMALPEGLLDL
ncbi:MAG: 16S rRNA processing protein RimM [Alistipes sp.]|nr:16S rRNA processing protein RimM [Alistipes sp.]